MKDTLKQGVTTTATYTVDKDRTIDFMGEECRVYATPSLVRDIEQTCRDLIMEHADQGEDSVGFSVQITHMAPTLLNMKATITATIAEVDRAKVVFDITANDGLDDICTGKHVRFVVDVEKTRQRLQAKAAKAAA
ncbi:MAG: hypothetical protein KDA67_13055 [Rhodobacteraceae bacterium]|nr:hypothetical protein [Paracoccaceae bacterium]